MVKVIFMGDSIVQYMPYTIDKSMKRGFNVPMISPKLSNYDIVYYICGIENIGIGSYHNYIWNQISNKEIDCYMLLIGINNILRPDCDYDGKQTLYDILDKLRNFIEDIMKNGKALFVQSIYPTDKIKINSQIIKINEFISNYCKENNICYIDMYNLLVSNNGKINPLYSDDGIHPNEYGYRMIINEMSNKIQQNNKRFIKRISYKRGE